jgi:DNA (cytosine-5)-methyltransferase 1
MKIKVGSLFDGIGGTPLSAVLSGAEPVWASEIEKVPISITKRHFPNMKHYGDITQINGAEIEPVDIIVGGSPCQDLSVAGKRAGLEGARSGLFMDQVRIVKEMRNATRRETSDRSTELPRPRYMVWENVPGAFSSNKGEDFRAVLEEICQVCDPEVSIPRPAKNKWLSSGTILGEGYSVAWRVVDAQHWGVPQRRRRIYLVADFGGHTAPEILFESESVPGDITEGGETGQRIATDAERGSGSSGESCVKSAGFIGTNGVKAHGIGYEEEKSPTLVAGRTNDVVIESIPVLNDQGGSVMGVSYGVTGTLRAQEHGHQPIVLNTVDRHAVCYGLVSKGNGEAFLMEEKHMSLSCGGGQAGQGYPAIVERRTDDAVCYGFASRQHSMSVTEDCANPLLSTDYKEPQAVCYGIGLDCYNHTVTGDISATLTAESGSSATHSGPQIMTNLKPVYSLDRACFNQGINAKYGIKIDENKTSTLVARGPSAVASPEQKYTVRRLTPLECERLQGYPDGWTALDYEGKAVSDTQRYKALGNSFAVPNAFFVISRCVKQLQKEEVNERD